MLDTIDYAGPDCGSITSKPHQVSLPRDIAGLFKPAFDVCRMRAVAIAPAIGHAMPNGMVYAGLAADRKHHLLVSPTDEMDAAGKRLRLTFRQAAAHAKAKGLQILSIEDMRNLHERVDAIGGFDKRGWYWSSSENRNNYARIQRFSDGYQTFDYDGYKYYGHYVRCARRCLVI